MGKCIYLRKGETHTPPIAGIKASDLPIGQIVKLMEGGVETEFIVVNQGIPSGSSLYDESCNGTWLLRKDIKEQRVWNNVNVLRYDETTINTWLNTEYFNILGITEHKKIKQVKIPYVQNGNVEPGVVLSGSDGLVAKIFLVSAKEVGFSLNDDDAVAIDGTKLDYFDATTTQGSSKRVAYFNGKANDWWTRSPVVGVNSHNAWDISNTGAVSGTWVQSSSTGIRPALIIPSTSVFDSTTYLLKR